jgi:rhodanese-related sulfurtransferase
VEDILIFAQEQILLVAALVILVTVFLRRESSAGGAKLSLSEVIQAMNADSAVLVDVRDSKDYDQGHVANAINVPHTKINDNLAVLEKHKAKQIIVTDNVGQQAAAASAALAKLGFNVARMRGGMAEWKQEGMPLVK